ncbi:MAG: hypothetical protein U0931_24645 [Vulcanimicrobiota bacterium]
MHIRNVSFVLNDRNEILSVADEFVEFWHVDGSPFLPGEVWGVGLWSHIQRKGLARAFQILLRAARQRPVSLPFRLDNESDLKLWQMDAGSCESGLLVSFRHLAQKPRPALPAGVALNKPVSPIEYCGWCNRVTKPGQPPDWLALEEAEYVEVLSLISRKAMSYKICNDCSQALLHSHEPKYFEHLSLGSGCLSLNGGPTLHMLAARS